MIHTLSVLVEDKPGALMRITSLFVRRGFNIESLAVGPTERPDVSRITLRVNCEQNTLEQIEKQMHKLVNVLRVNELEPGEAVERELLLIKVAAPPDRRAELMALGDVFHARVLDLGPDALIFEVVGPPEELESFEELVRPHGIKDLVRTGRVGLARASRETEARSARRLQVLR
jgi:acetolactate synthase I/III small subunit